MMTEQSFETLLQVECPDSTYRPCEPLILSQAEGVYLISTTGQRYLDLCAGFGSLAFGHNPPHFKAFLESFQTQCPPIVQGLGDLYPSQAKIDFLISLVAAMPDHISRASLALTGSGAVETALKTAMLYAKGKSGFIAFENGYHGVDFGALPVTYRQDFKAPFMNALPQSHVIHLPIHAPADMILAAQRKLDQHCGFAGIIVEPIQGRGGIVKAEHAWLEQLLDLAHQAEGVLIFDEIFCGLGRAGRLTTSEVVAADIIILGKALGGGLPISACLGTEAVMQAWPENSGEAIHTGTFFGHPFNCGFAHRSLQALIEQDLVRQSQHKGRVFKAKLETQLAGVSKVKGIRGEGLFLGVEFTEPGAGVVIMDILRDSYQTIAIPCGPEANLLSLSPALTITEAELDLAADRIYEAILAARL